MINFRSSLQATGASAVCGLVSTVLGLPQHCGVAGHLARLFTVGDFLELRIIASGSNNAVKMANAADICQKLQNGLDPYVKSREQISYIRRILAVQLAQFTQDGSARPPLALAAASDEPRPDEKGLDGLYKEYLY